MYAATDTVVVTEGVETGLAVHLMTGLPVWAAVSTGGMKQLVVPGRVRLVVICLDHDEAGLDAARTLARRMLAEGRRVKLLAPDSLGEDWADVAAQEVCLAR